MEKFCGPVDDKLCHLISSLRRLPGKLETIADEIGNENLRNALWLVADESYHYSMELDTYIRNKAMISFDHAKNNLEDDYPENEFNASPCEKGTEILSICENLEAFFSALYNELINDFFSNTTLRNMMNYQLLGIRSAFMRIKFLNAVRFTEEINDHY